MKLILIPGVKKIFHFKNQKQKKMSRKKGESQPPVKKETEEKKEKTIKKIEKKAPEVKIKPVEKVPPQVQEEIINYHKIGIIGTNDELKLFRSKLKLKGLPLGKVLMQFVSKWNKEN